MDAGAYQLELVKKAVAGNVAALTVVLTDVHEQLRARLSRRMPRDLRGSVDADDILQEAQVEAYLHIDTFVPRGPDSFYRWVSTIAIRRLRNTIKKQRALKRGGGRLAVSTLPTATESSVVALLNLMAGPDKTPSRTAATQEAVEALEVAMTELPEDYRRAVQLVYIEGCTVAEAAKTLGRTDRAIHNLCYKAKEHLRGLLGSGSRFLSSS
jgi:RNA polymerase sigma-70 factor (ECF subfamily)